jgi:hypothetical protein
MAEVRLIFLPLSPIWFFIMINLQFVSTFEMKGASGPALTALWYAMFVCDLSLPSYSCPCADPTATAT